MKSIFAILFTSLLFQVALLPAASLAADKRQEHKVPADDSWRRPDVVLEALAPKSGESVADIGAGTGYYIGALANLVGSKGTVYATDVDESALQGLERLKATHNFVQMSVIRSAHEATGLPANSVDAVLLSHTLHDLKQPGKFLASLKQALKRNARIVVVEVHKKDDGFFPPKAARLGYFDARRIIESAGYRVSESREIPRQYILVCRPN